MPVDAQISDLLKLVDELIFNYTGRQLDSVKKAILTGALNNKNYLQIAQETGYSDSHLKNIGAELFNLLSDIAGEKITKKNVKYIFNKTKDNKFISDFKTNNLNVNHFNYCGEKNQDELRQIFKQSQSEVKQKYFDLDEAPIIFNYFNRQSELKILKQFILEEEIKLVNIYGLCGTGKSILARQLVEEIKIKQEFDYIIWRNLSSEINLLELKKDLHNIFSSTQLKPITKLINAFSDYRCLIILDDLQSLFKPIVLAGELLPEFQNYCQFFQKIVTTNHQSCFILISQDKLRSFSIWENQNHPVKSWQINGLGEKAKTILSNHSLKDEEYWLQLIELYQGNPLWLNLICATIKDLFNSSIKQFLTVNNDRIFLGEIELFLKEYLVNLSTIEKELIIYCFNHNLLNFTLPEIGKYNQDIAIIQSLQRRCLVDKLEKDNQTVFSLNPILSSLCFN